MNLTAERDTRNHKTEDEVGEAYLKSHLATDNNYED